MAYHEIENKYGDRLLINIFSSDLELYRNNVDVKFDKKFIQQGNSGYENLLSQERIKKRTGSVLFNLSQTSDLQYNYILNSIVAFLSSDYPYYLVDIENQKRTEVEFIDIKEPYVNGMQQRFSNIQISFVMKKSYWESTNVSSESFTGLNDGDTFQVICPNYMQSTPFQATIIHSSGINTTISLENTNRENNYGLVISEIGFIAGKEIFIDTSNGTFTLNPDGTNISSSVSFGEPFNLLKGTNVFTFSSPLSGVVNIEIDYNVRTLF